MTNIPIPNCTCSDCEHARLEKDREIRMSSAEINAHLAAIEAVALGIEVHGLEGSGKLIPYIGWYWRTVDFDEPIRLGMVPSGVPSWKAILDPGVRQLSDLIDPPRDRPLIGFMEKNKWGYPEWETTIEQTVMIRKLCEAVAQYPIEPLLQALFDYIQTCGPTGESVHG